MARDVHSYSVGPRQPKTPRSGRRAKPRTKREATERLAAADRALAERIGFQQLNDLTLAVEQAAASGEEPAGRSPLTGEPLPPTNEVREAHAANLRRAFADRLQLLEGTLTVAEVAELLSVGRQTPHDRRKAGALLGVKDGGGWRFPSWQFDAEGPDGIVEGLREANAALPPRLSDLGRVRWFATSKSLLDGRTPIEALDDGDIDEVVAEAEAFGVS